MVDFLSTVAEIADVDSTVLLDGETGTGKGMVARFLHRLSNRGAKPESLVESALRPRARRVHRLAPHRKEGAVRAREWWHDLPRRDRRAAAAVAGEAAAGPRREGGPPARRDFAASARRACDLRHESQSPRPRGAGAIPRGPPLPHRGDPAAHPAAPRAARRQEGPPVRLPRSLQQEARPEQNVLARSGGRPH